MKTFKDFQDEAGKMSLDQKLDVLQLSLNRIGGRFGVHIQLSKHFNTRIHVRNYSDVDSIKVMFEKLLDKHLDLVKQMAQNEEEAVVRDAAHQINIPIVVKPNGKFIQIIAKTILQKKDFKTHSPLVNILQKESKNDEISIILIDDFYDDFVSFLHNSFN